MKRESGRLLADLAYFRALDSAKKLSDQVEYFRRKESPRREEMVALAVDVLEAHMVLVEKLRLEYIERNGEVVERSQIERNNKTGE